MKRSKLKKGEETGEDSNTRVITVIGNCSPRTKLSMPSNAPPPPPKVRVPVQEKKR